MSAKFHCLIGGCCLALLAACAAAQETIRIGSKRFTESYILGEIVARTAQRAGEARVVHEQGLGNTAILFAALKSGAVHVYPEYTGTIAFELLGLSRAPQSLEALNRELAPHGLAAGVPLGFNNTYALAMAEERAAALGIHRISDLAQHPRLRFGLSQEFANRRDGWPALRVAYGLDPGEIRGLDHGLAYEALAAGRVDVIDAYATDARIGRYRVRLLEDDRHFFPAYEAVLLYRTELPQRYPQTWRMLQSLEHRITAAHMISLNAAVELGGMPFAKVAEDFLAGRIAEAHAGRQGFGSLLEALFAADLGRLTAEHLLLVFASLALSVACGLPLGILAARASRARPFILGAVGMLQTVPSLALLAFLIAALDRIGTLPAVIALFLYALLPIVRNTCSGLADIPASLRESGEALGLPPSARLRLIELPLAARSILSGIKTSGVINVGTATIAAFIGAGGYGERIVAGLAVNDHRLLLAGALPAAALALAIQWAFDALDRVLISPGLREPQQAPQREGQ
jgi:osmoprotectant transport system permease protein